MIFSLLEYFRVIGDNYSGSALELRGRICGIYSSFSKLISLILIHFLHHTYSSACKIILQQQKKKRADLSIRTKLQQETAAASDCTPKILLNALETNYPQRREIAHYGLSVHSLTFDPFKCTSPAVTHWMAVCRAYQEVMRYWAKLMLTGVPVMVTWRSLVPSSWLPILIWAPDTCLISLILVP